MSYKHSYKYKQQHFRLCVPLCPRYFGWRYTQSICCLFWSEAWESVFQGADCPRLRSPRLSSRFCRGRAVAVIVGIAHRSADVRARGKAGCVSSQGSCLPAFSLRTFRSWRALFEEGAVVSPRSSVPAFAEAERLLRPWGSQHGSGERVRDGSALSLPFFLDLALSLGARKPALRFFPPLSESSCCCGCLSPSLSFCPHMSRLHIGIARFYLPSLLGKRGAGIDAIYVWFVRELSMHIPPLSGQAVSIHNRTTYLGVVWDRRQCRRVFLLLGSSHPRGSQESGSRLVTHCEAVSTTAGSDGSCIQPTRERCLPPLVMTLPAIRRRNLLPLTVALPAIGGHCLICLSLPPGPSVGSSLLPRNASDGRVPHRLGSGHEWPPRPQSVERSPSSLAHQLPGDAGHVADTEKLSPGRLLRAGPSGAEWGPPHSSVPVSPQCPREISLPTLPVLQGAAVSSEPTPQSLPPGNVAELGSPPPLRGSLEQAPFRMIKVTRRCLRALDMWKKPWFLSQGPVLEAPCRRVMLATDVSLTGWGAVMSGHSARGLWSGRHLTWHINCLEMLAVFLALKHFLPDLIGRHVLVRTNNTAVVYYINHQGWLVHQISVIIVIIADSSACAWASQYGSRHPVEAGPEARGMDASPRGGEADLESFWPGSAPLGLDAMVQTWPRLRLYAFPPIALLPGVLERVRRDRVHLLSDLPLHGRFPSGGISSRKREAPSFALAPAVVEVRGVASEGAHLVASGLSTEVVQTIFQSRAPSTRKLYALKWKLFTSWCGHRQQDPVNCPVGTVLEYLQDRFSAGLAHSTLRVYVVAISAYHAPLGGMSVGKDPLVVCFLCSALRLRPPVRPRVPTWDLAVLLEALCKPPFEPIKESLDHHLSAKTALLLALTSLKRVGDLQALSVAPSHLEFAPGMAKAFLYPRSGYVPKAYEFSDLHSTRGVSASKAFMSGVPMQDICDAAGWSTPLIFVRLYDLDLQTQLEFLKGNVSGYDCNPGFPKGTRRCVSCHTFCIPASVSFFLKLNAGYGACALKLHPPMTSCLSIGPITHVIQSTLTLGTSPKRYSYNLRRFSPSSLKRTSDVVDSGVLVCNVEVVVASGVVVCNVEVVVDSVVVVCNVEVEVGSGVVVCSVEVVVDSGVVMCNVEVVVDSGVVVCNMEVVADSGAVVCNVEV
ncbi:enzymatic polyprotein [Labeo rohita]|uniref:Enzymatic polyprotein n=1 Tax=Labeo rohita TaxID=84645 RepID=A0ABQ8L6P9_LABRO|nr:enzymatic polyprotein [Labeo rohita]